MPAWVFLAAMPSASSVPTLEVTDSLPLIDIKAKRQGLKRELVIVFNVVGFLDVTPGGVTCARRSRAHGWMDGWMRTSVRGFNPSLRNIHWPLLPPPSHQAALWAE